MQAVMYTQYGPPDVLRLIELRKPQPKPNEVLIRTHVTTVTSAECAMRKGQPYWGRVILGLWRPRRAMRIPGTEVAGTIEAVGSAVTRFKPGDQVFGFTGFALKACAEYLCLPETASLALKPGGLSFAEAVALVDGASTALFFLRKGGLQPGQRILINGAAGSIGAYAVQIARQQGAHVTGVCSGRNAELVRALGADAVIDYTTTDFTQGADRYDIVFDTIGKSSFSRSRRVLTPDGRYLATNIGPRIFAQMLLTSARHGQRVVSGMSVNKLNELAQIKALFEAGQLKPLIDRRYPLSEIVAAHRYVETGRKRGNVVIEIIAEAQKPEARNEP